MTLAGLPKQTGSSTLSGTRAGLAGTLVPRRPSLSPHAAAARPPPDGSAIAAASPAIARALQNDFIGVVNSVSPSVVVIETKTGLVSGVVFNANGDILTNNHVVTGSKTFSVTLADGRKLDGTLVGTYPAGDLAVIHVSATDLQPATFGDSSKLVVGDIVLAVGNPLGLQTTVTEGIVSAIGRDVSESSAVTLSGIIQTSADINPGNSGGALVDLSGRVVGIPTLAALDPEFNDTPASGNRLCHPQQRRGRCRGAADRERSRHHPADVERSTVGVLTTQPTWTPAAVDARRSRDVRIPARGGIRSVPSPSPAPRSCRGAR